MSVTVALAAVMASSALTLIFGVGCDPALGSSTRTTVSQNAIRKRNRIVRPSCPRGDGLPHLAGNLAVGVEAPVGHAVRFFSKFDEN